MIININECCVYLTFNEKESKMDFDDFFGQDEFLIDPEDAQNLPEGAENWDTGIAPDIFKSGENQDIFNTKDLLQA